jgi:translocation and assembly module TamB
MPVAPDQADPRQTASPRRFRRFRLLAWLLGVILALPILALAFAFAVLHSDAGRAWLVGFVESSVSTPGEMELSIGRLDGSLLGSAEVSDLRLADAEGDFFTLDRLALSWTPWALIQRHLVVESIEVGEISLLRAPEATAEESEPSPPALAAPSLPVDIAVDRVRIRRLRLGAALLGSEVSLALVGGLSLDRAGLARALLDIDAEAPQSGRITARLDLDLPAQQLSAEIEAQSDSDGPLTALLGLTAATPLTLRLHGQGPLQGWHGELAAGAGPDLELATDFIIAGLDPLVMTIRGDARLSLLLPEDLRPLVGETLSFDLPLEMATDGSLALRAAQLEAALGRLDLDATADPAGDRLSLVAEANLDNGAVLGGLIAPARLAAARLSLRAEGSLLQPDIDLEAEIEGIGLDDLAMDRLAAEVNLRPDRAFDASGLVIAFESRGRADGLAVAPAELAQVLGESGEWQTRGSLSPDDGRLALDELILRASPAALSLNGELDLVALAGSFRFEARHDALANLAALTGLDLAGRLAVAGTVERPEAPARTEVELTARTTDLSLGLAEVDALAGESPSLTTRLSLGDDGALDIAALELDGAAVTLTFAGAVAPNLAADYRLSLDDLDRLAPSLGLALAGSLEAQGRLAGPLEDPDVTAELTSAEITLDEMVFTDLSAEITASSPVSAPKASLSLSAQSSVGALSAGLALAAEGPDRWAVSDIDLRRDGDRVTGALVIEPTAPRLTGQIDILASDLAGWSQLAGLDLAGSVDGSIAFPEAEGPQAANVTLKAAGVAVDLDGDRLELAGAELRASLADLWQEPRAEASLSLSEASLAPLALAGATAKFNGGLTGGGIALELDGKLEDQAIALSAEGSFAQAGQDLQIALAELEASYGELPLRLRQAARLGLSPTQSQIEDLDLEIGSGRLHGQARLSETTVDAALVIEQLDLEDLALAGPAPPFEGRIDGRLELSGSSAGPDGQLTLRLSELRSDDEAMDELPALSASLDGNLGNGRAALTGELAGLGTTPLTVEAEFPLALSLTPFDVSVDETAPLSLVSNWTGEASQLMAVLPVDVFTLTGQLSLNTQLGGTVNDPVFTGDVKLEEGVYENFTSGTLLRPLRMAITGANDHLRFELEGRDGNKGRLSAEGDLALGDVDATSFEVVARLDKATLVRRDDVTASLSGEIKLAGSPEKAELAGQIQSELIEVRLVDDLPPSVVELEVEDLADADEEQPPAEAAQGGPEIGLDLAIDLPRRVFVRGRGLESEWTGRFQVTGSAEKPEIVGHMEPLRGSFTFAGKRFDLEDSRISFAGGTNLDPDLDISAVHTGKEIKAIILITGPASAPEFELTSEPELPDDEILAQVLFGRSSGQLSAGEAVQLASALASLTGTSGPGILDFARAQLGVDVLEFTPGEDEDETGRLRAGRYLDDRTYIQLEQGMEAGSTGATVEYEVTPSITLESDVGNDQTGRVGARWRWDY